MRTRMFFAMCVFAAACAHRTASEPTAATPTKAEAPAAVAEDSGDPRLGELELVTAPATARAESAGEVEATGAKDEVAQPRAIEPAAPTVATAPPGSAFTPPPDQTASKSEAELRERIQRTLQRDSSLSFTAKRVRVEVERGRVTLLGEVRSTHEKSEVEELVQKVSGVQRVRNQLAVIDQTPGANTLDPSASGNRPLR